MTQASYRALNPEPWLTPSDPKRSDSFQYDALGSPFGSNRIASRGIYLDFTRRDNGLNQYHMWSPYSGLFYDDNFNANWQFPGNGVMMADGYFTASYNALNQPVAMGSQGLGNNFYWFWHDPLGRCVKRWLGNGNGFPTGPITYLYYGGWNLVQEGPNASTADRVYVHGARVDEIVARKIGGEKKSNKTESTFGSMILKKYSGTIMVLLYQSRFVTEADSSKVIALVGYYQNVSVYSATEGDAVAVLRGNVVDGRVNWSESSLDATRKNFMDWVRLARGQRFVAEGGKAFFPKEEGI